MEISRQTALEILNLKDTFSTEALNKRYRELSKLLHPDTGGDENLFKLLTCCKDVLTNTSPQSNSTGKPSSSSTQKTKPSYYVDLKTLYDIYFDLSQYILKCDIAEVRGMARLYIAPCFKKKLCVSTDISLDQPFEHFQRAGFANFSKSISIPDSLKNFNKFNVRVEFMGHTYRFTMSLKDPFHIIKHRDIRFNSVVELKFE